QSTVGEPTQPRRRSAGYVVEHGPGHPVGIDRHHPARFVGLPPLQIGEPQLTVAPAGALGERQAIDHQPHVTLHVVRRCEASSMTDVWGRLSRHPVIPGRCSHCRLYCDWESAFSGGVVKSLLAAGLTVAMVGATSLLASGAS